MSLASFYLLSACTKNDSPSTPAANKKRLVQIMGDRLPDDTTALNYNSSNDFVSEYYYDQQLLSMPVYDSSGKMIGINQSLFNTTKIVQSFTFRYDNSGKIVIAKRFNWGNDNGDYDSLVYDNNSALKMQYLYVSNGEVLLAVKSYKWDNNKNLTELRTAGTVAELSDPVKGSTATYTYGNTVNPIVDAMPRAYILFTREESQLSKNRATNRLFRTAYGVGKTITEYTVNAEAYPVSAKITLTDGDTPVQTYNAFYSYK